VVEYIIKIKLTHSVAYRFTLFAFLAFLSRITLWKELIITVINKQQTEILMSIIRWFKRLSQELALSTFKRWWQFSADYMYHQLISFLISDYSGILDSHIKSYTFSYVKCLLLQRHQQTLLVFLHIKHNGMNHIKLICCWFNISKNHLPNMNKLYGNYTVFPVNRPRDFL
jgi:hypothetical protein